MLLVQSRIFQYIVIIALLMLAGGGGYAYYRSKAAQTTTDNRPSFEVPLKTNLNLTAGTGTATYSRADGADRRATVTDFEGLTRPVKAGEARFTGARRVENLTSYSENLQGAGWTVIGTGVSVTSATAVSFSTKASTSAVQYASTIFDGKAGQTITWRIEASGSGNIVVRISNGVDDVLDQTITLSSVPKVYSATKTFNATTASNSYFRFYSLTADAATITKIQVENVTGQSNQNPSEYVSTNVRTAFPYHGAGVDGVRYFATQNGNTVASNVVTEAVGAAISESTLRGYLAEGSRTNLQLRSEEFDSVGWAKTNASVTASAAVSPSGSPVADKIIEDTANAQHKCAQTVTSTAGSPVTASLYAKKAERHIGLHLWNATDGTFGKAEVNLDTGSVYNSTGTVLVTALSGGWYRIAVTATPTVAASSYIIMPYNGSSVTYTGDGSSGLYVWGAQYEQASFASSYIPTTSASVTRAADSLAYPMVGNFDDVAGSASLEFVPGWTGTAGSNSAFWIASYNGGSSPERRLSIWEWSGASNNIISDRSADNTVTRNSASTTAIALVSGTAVKVGMKWDASSVKLFGNGSLRSTDSTLTLPYDSLSGGSVYIGKNYGSNSEAYSSLKNVRAWKKALTDTELNNLTSLTQAVSDSAFKQAVNRPPDNTGLVGYWSFEDGAGTKATDFSGNGNHGTLTNGPTWADGRFGKAASFDGTNDYIDGGQGSSLALSDNFTLSTWINPSSLHATGYFGLKNVFLYRGDSSSSTINYLLQAESDTSIVFKKRVGAEGIVSYSFTGVPSLTGRWSHVMLTVSSGTATLFVNGTKISSQAIAALGYQSGQNLYLGTSINNNGASSEQFFLGRIDDVRIYSRVLSDTEISNLYQKTSSAKLNASQNDRMTNGLVGLWSFNGPDLSGTTAYDRSGQGNNGTLTNGPAITEGRIGQALSFDGTNDYVSMSDSDAIDFGAGSDFSVALWVRAPSTQSETVNSDNAILEKWAGTGGYPYALRINNQTYGVSGDRGKLVFRRYDGTYSPAVVSVSAANDNIWHHVVGTKNGSVLTLYVDGVTSGTGTDTTVSSTTNNASLYVGARGGTINRFMGSIDDVRIYSRALSATEVVALYNQGK